MGHTRTNKTLHATEILTHLKSFNNYIHSTEDKPSQTSSSFFRNNWFLGLNSIISLQHLPRTTLFKLICRVHADSANIDARQPVLEWNFLGCMEFTDWLLANQFFETLSVRVDHLIKGFTSSRSFTQPLFFLLFLAPRLTKKSLNLSFWFDNSSQIIKIQRPRDCKS